MLFKKKHTSDHKCCGMCKHMFSKANGTYCTCEYQKGSGFSYNLMAKDCQGFEKRWFWEYREFKDGTNLTYKVPPVRMKMEEIESRSGKSYRKTKFNRSGLLIHIDKLDEKISDWLDEWLEVDKSLLGRRGLYSVADIDESWIVYTISQSEYTEIRGCKSQKPVEVVCNASDLVNVSIESLDKYLETRTIPFTCPKGFIPSEDFSNDRVIELLIDNGLLIPTSIEDF